MEQNPASLIPAPKTLAATCVRLVAERDKSDNYSRLCGGHIEALALAVDVLRPMKITEFGGGRWSTPILLAGGEQVLTVEQGQHVAIATNEHWAQDLMTRYVRNPNWRCLYAPGFSFDSFFPHALPESDLLFIDGFTTHRHILLRRALEQRIRTVIAHDTEQPAYRWASVAVPEGYVVFDYLGFKDNMTTVWTLDPELRRVLAAHRDFRLRGAPITQRKVISVSLYGDKPMYVDGTLRLARTYKDLYGPDWELCIFADTTQEVISQLTELGATVVPFKTEKQSGLFYRFLPEADVLLVRDVDVVTSPREIDAVNDWLTTDFGWMNIRDHDGQRAPINGGLLGVKGRENVRLLNMVMRTALGRATFAYGDDERVLAEKLFPQVERDMVEYSSQPYPARNRRPLRPRTGPSDVIGDGICKYRPSTV